MANFSESNTAGSVGKDVNLVIAVQRTAHGVECGWLDNHNQSHKGPNPKVNKAIQQIKTQANGQEINTPESRRRRTTIINCTGSRVNKTKQKNSWVRIFQEKGNDQRTISRTTNRCSGNLFLSGL